MNYCGCDACRLHKVTRHIIRTHTTTTTTIGWQLFIGHTRKIINIYHVIFVASVVPPVSMLSLNRKSVQKAFIRHSVHAAALTLCPDHRATLSIRHRNSFWWRCGSQTIMPPYWISVIKNASGCKQFVRRRLRVFAFDLRRRAQSDVSSVLFAHIHTHTDTPAGGNGRCRLWKRHRPTQTRRRRRRCVSFEAHFLSSVHHHACCRTSVPPPMLCCCRRDHENRKWTAIAWGNEGAVSRQASSPFWNITSFFSQPIWCAHIQRCGHQIALW